MQGTYYSHDHHTTAESDNIEKVRRCYNGFRISLIVIWLVFVTTFVQAQEQLVTQYSPLLHSNIFNTDISNPTTPKLSNVTRGNDVSSTQELGKGFNATNQVGTTNINVTTVLQLLNVTAAITTFQDTGNGTEVNEIDVNGTISNETQSSNRTEPYVDAPGTESNNTEQNETDMAGSVTINCSFYVASSVKINETITDQLLESFREYVLDILAAQRRQRQRTRMLRLPLHLESALQKRRLEVTLIEESVVVSYLSSCPPSTTTLAFCQAMEGQYDMLFTTDENITEVQDRYVNATQFGIEYGSLGRIVAELNPQSVLTIIPPQSLDSWNGTSNGTSNETSNGTTATVMPSMAPSNAPNPTESSQEFKLVWSAALAMLGMFILVSLFGSAATFRKRLPL